jgi:inorganic pyrophosphatase
MKSLLENWNKFINEAEEEESSSVSYDKMISLIKGEGASEITINIDAPKGKKKGFGAPEKTKLPFDYGEFPDYINDADGMGWDLIIAPSESGKEWNKVGNLLPVGRVGYKKGSDKEDNDKIVMASKEWPDKKKDKKDIEDFFGKLKDRFDAPSWDV